MARPKDVDLDRRLLRAAWTLLTDEGYEAVTFAGVATRAGAHRSDVYRRWSSRVRLVIDAVAEHAPLETTIDTGSLRSDLRHFLADLASAWAMPWMDGYVAMLADVRSDPAAEEAYRSVVRRRSQPLIDLVARAVARGEISELPAPGVLGGLLEGPLMHRRMFFREELTDDELDRIADIASQQLERTVAQS